MSVDIKFVFPDWAARLKRHEQEINLFQAAQIQFNRGMLFDAEGGRNGHQKWAPLSFRNGQILSNRGTLRKSIAPYNPNGRAGQDGIVRFSGDTITIGTKLAYARMMNDGTAKMPGGVLRAKDGKCLRIPLPSGANATKTTREIRLAPTMKRIQLVKERLAKAEARHLRAAVRFSKTGSNAAMASAVKHKSAVLNHEAALERLDKKAWRINTMGKGGENFLFVKSVKIPAREFDKWTDQDQAELDVAMMAKITEVLNV